MDGNKRYEFRKVDCKRDVNHIMIYSTYPVKMIVGEASVKKEIGMLARRYVGKNAHRCRNKARILQRLL